MDLVLHCRWRDDADGEWVFGVGRAPDGSGSGWQFLAGAPGWSETLPFEDTEQVGAFARALLELPHDEPPPEQPPHEDLPPEQLPRGPEPFEQEWQLARTENGRTHFATLAVGLDPLDDHRPYLAYQSYYAASRATALGLELIYEGLPVDHLREQARTLLTTLTGPDRGQS
ncbi:hypothetical protein ACGFZP_30430 [Kitasatospora sp. NPDC048239]|uniref:hypothetical protein n=1 Tax=Kitasatospora sp. NPDC048239 TaxID=3364046 RepID=UPI00371B8CBC